MPQKREKCLIIDPVCPRWSHLPKGKSYSCIKGTTLLVSNAFNHKKMHCWHITRPQNFFSQSREINFHFSFSPWFSRLLEQNCPVTKVWPTALHLTNDKRLWSNLRQLPKKSTTAFFLKYDCQESWKVGLSWSKKCKEVVSWWPSAGVLPDHKIQRKPKHSEISHLQICHQTAERTIRKSKRKTK